MPLERSQARGALAAAAKGWRRVRSAKTRHYYLARTPITATIYLMLTLTRRRHGPEAPSCVHISKECSRASGAHS